MNTIASELSSAARKGYLVLDGSQIAEVELCHFAYEPAVRFQVPEKGHLIVRLRELDRDAPCRP